MELTWLKKSEIPLFQAFIKKHWNANHIFAFEDTVFRFQHQEKGVPNLHYCIAKQGNDIVGIQGIIPLSIYDVQLPKNQLFLTLWKALEDRGVAMGLSIYRTICKEYEPEFIGVIGLNTKVIPFYEIEGYVIGEMDHHVLLVPDIEYRIADAPSDVSLPPVNGDAKCVPLLKEDLLNLSLETLFENQFPTKSTTYFIHRYLEHPVYTYMLWGIYREEVLEGLLVGRFVNEKGSKALRIIDFAGPDILISSCGTALLEILQSEGAEYADMYSNGLESLFLTTAGFINKAKYEALIVPNHFEPFEQQNKKLIFAHKSLGDKKVRLFKGDGDQDRPNLIL